MSKLPKTIDFAKVIRHEFLEQIGQNSINAKKKHISIEFEASSDTLEIMRQLADERNEFDDTDDFDVDGITVDDELPLLQFKITKITVHV